MIELKPCPFCGGTPNLRTGETYPNGEKGVSLIKCQTCNYAMSTALDVARIIVRWNSRPLEDALAEFARHVDKSDAKALTPDQEALL